MQKKAFSILKVRKLTLEEMIWRFEDPEVMMGNGTMRKGNVIGKVVGEPICVTKDGCMVPHLSSLNVKSVVSKE